MTVTRDEVFAAMQAAVAADDWRLADRIAIDNGFLHMCRECGCDVADPKQRGHRDSHVMPICWGCDAWNRDFDNPKSWAYEDELYFYTGPPEYHWEASNRIWKAIAKKP